jgi:thymidylate synthase (FAD)
MSSEVKLIAVSKIVDQELLKELNSNNAEELIMYAARVSSKDQTSGNPKLLNYCIKHGHWSVFEQASMTLEIITSRAISAQILRHKSFNFQEFSQRYSKTQELLKYPARRQDITNRQNSLDDLDQKTKDWFNIAQDNIKNLSLDLYDKALAMGIAKEQARFLLPMSSKTKLYMTGPLRSWITYINLRSGNGTQKEHQDIAIKAKEIFINEFPVISNSLSWRKDA